MDRSLRSNLESLAADFASRLVNALVSHAWTVEVAELLRTAGPTARRSRRRVRRPGTASKVHLLPGSPSYVGNRRNRGYDAIQADVDRIVAVLADADGPVKSKRIRNALGITKDRFLRTVHRAIAAGRVRALGELASQGYVLGHREQRNA